MSIIVDLVNKVENIKAGSVSAGEGQPEEEDTYSLQLQKDANSLFGLGYRVNHKDEVYITSIAPKSLIEDWNSNCELDKTVCAGDKIVSVNRKTGARAICEEMKGESINAMFSKTGPRWHINGITADSMEKIGAAQGKGLAFELQDVEGEQEETKEPMINFMQVIAVFICLGIPSGLTIGFFSDIGLGFKIAEIFAPYMRNWIGNGIVFIGTVFATGLYVADWTQWPSGGQKYMTGVFTVYLIMVGAIFKMRYYPEVPLVACLFHVPVGIAVFRATVLKSVKRKSFYIVVTVVLFIWALACLGVWLFWMVSGKEGEDGFKGKHLWNDATKALLVRDADPIYKEWKIKKAGDERRTFYDMDCAADIKADHICSLAYCAHPVFSFGGTSNLANEVTGDNGLYCCTATGCVLSDSACAANEEYLYLTADGRRCCNKEMPLTDYDGAVSERRDNCAKVKTVWFLLWVSPFVVFGVNFIMATFCLANGVWLNAADTGKLEKVMKQFSLMTFCLLLMIWISVSVAGASMRLTSAMIAFCVAGLVVLVVWVYLEIGSRVITISVQNSRLMQSLIGLATSDWVRAGCLIGLNILIPLAFIVNMMNQTVRRIRGASRSDSKFTDGMLRIIMNLKNWNWCSILMKVNWLCLAYWLLSVGVAKLTVVFLSFLNKWLLGIDFVVVIIVFFLIGFTMFMLPPVPGLPVYMSAGIVMSSRARDMDGVGFAGGTAIACALSFVLKLIAVAGQYMIGYFLGRSTKIQQMVGVDKVFIRAVQHILEKKGIPLSKVAVLVGGPDWPTSVLCGILRLSLFQCELGTMPVIFVSSPVVLAGAFMAGPSSDPVQIEKESGIWAPLKAVMMGLAALAQLASGVIALYYIQEVIYAHGAELAKPRKEHEAIAKLTRAEQEYVKAYNEVLDWKKFSRAHKPIILVSTGAMLLSNFIFVFMDEACFITDFEVTSDISKSVEEGGLGGEALGIVKPIGWMTHVLFFFGASLHFCFLRFAKFEATRKVQENKQKLADLVAEGTLATESEEKRKSTGPRASGTGGEGGFKPQRSSGLRRSASQGGSDGGALY